MTKSGKVFNEEYGYISEVTLLDGELHRTRAIEFNSTNPDRLPTLSEFKEL